jgi:hypothetical protein
MLGASTAREDLSHEAQQQTIATGSPRRYRLGVGKVLPSSTHAEFCSLRERIQFNLRCLFGLTLGGLLAISLVLCNQHLEWNEPATCAPCQQVAH